MSANWLKISITGYLAFLLAGCNQSPVPNAPESPVDPLAGRVAMTETQALPAVPTRENETEINPSLPIPAVPGLQRQIEKAKADLAERMAISVDEITVLKATGVLWPDSSLGCPQPGNTYTQIQTPGYLILLGQAANQFEYHANIHNSVFFCENPTPPIVETPGNVQP